MNIYVLDTSFNVIDIVDSYESSIWNIKYYEYGDFELYLPATTDNIELLKVNCYLVRDVDIIDDNLYNVMRIKKINVNTDVEQGNHLTLTGKCLKSIMAQRIVWGQTNLSGTVESCIRALITSNVINPTNSARRIDKVILSEIKGYTESMVKQITGDNLGDSIIDICKTYGVGWRVYVDKNKNIVVDVFKGVDRSNNQTLNPRVTFSPELDTLLTSDYSLDTENYKNVALVAGEGEGKARKTVTVGTAEGLDRYETYVDVRDQSSNDGEITDADYYKNLAEKGTESLEATTLTESYEGEIEVNSNYIYGVDYHIGDIVNIKNEYDITATPRVIGVIDSYSNEGRTVIPTFSTWKGE